jgi:3-methyladenine DNA glycosylase/8-oxoguanine DNA glycosylase
VKRAIVSQRGLGEWTAEWFLARHLARPHAWPWGDLALRKAVADLYGGLDVREARERFHPYENLTAHYLLLAHRHP